MMTTDRLTLRTATLADASFIAREIANPQVQQWLTTPPHPYQLEHAQEFIADLAQQDGYFLIEDCDGPVGFVAIRDPKRWQDSADELGYWLAVGAHGKGYMTEATIAVLDWYFDLGAEFSESGWLEGNGPSENVLTKLGFVKTGVIENTYAHFHGKKMRTIRVRLTRDAWMSRKDE